jgi:IS5 family transposase
LNDLYSSDRGFFNPKNVQDCKDLGVKFTCIPQSGGKRSAKQEAFEKSPAFKKGQRFRAGIEGRISVLFRGRGMKRVLVEGREHFEMLVGAAILANNLLVIAERPYGTYPAFYSPRGYCFQWRRSNLSMK